MRKTVLANNLDITMVLTCYNKIYFNFSNHSITYLAVKTANHNSLLKKKLILKRSIIRSWKLPGFIWYGKAYDQEFKRANISPQIYGQKE